MKSYLLKVIDFLNLYPLFNRFTANAATVFMLHQVLPAGTRRDGEISADYLDEFLAYLKKHHYNVIPLADYIDALSERRPLYKTVVFTVDDGFRDFYVHAYPIFKKYNFPAAIFLTSDFIENGLFLWWNRIEFALKHTARTEVDLGSLGRGKHPLRDESDRKNAARVISKHLKQLSHDAMEQFIDELIAQLDVDISGQPEGEYQPLTWDEIHRMSQDGIEFYPHTKTHPIMSRISYPQKIVELAEPKRIIEEKLRRKADIFAYPNGEADDIDHDTIKALRETGYRAALTTTPGFDYTSNGNDLFRIHRIGLASEPLWFKQYVSGLESFKHRHRSRPAR